MLRVGTFVLAVTLALWAGSKAGEAAPQDAEPRATMDRIFEALTELLPLSLRETGFEQAQNREAILASLQVLVDAADRLEEHAKGRDPAFAFLGRLLAADVQDIQRRYLREHYQEARYLLHQLTNTCVACHSRLPEARKQSLGERLTKRVEVNALDPDQRARLQIATRQFDAALVTYEKLFADPSVPPVSMDLGGYFVEYLTVSIRVKRDLKRPVPELKKLARRSDLPLYLRRNVTRWTETLVELQAESAEAPTLERARALVQKARDLSEFSWDRAGLIYDLVASSVLHRVIDTAAYASSVRSEAFYLLGVTEWRTRRSYWVSEAEFYLETAIRTAPQSPFAQRAYALLEEYTVLGYSGSEGVNIPPDVQAKLDELRGMLDGP